MLMDMRCCPYVSHLPAGTRCHCVCGMRVVVMTRLGMGVFVLDLEGLRLAASEPHQCPPHAGDYEHPPAAKPEVAPEADERIDDVDSEEDQGEPDNAPHHRIYGRRYAPARDHSERSQDHEDQGVPRRVHGRERQGAAPVTLRTRDIGYRGDVIDVEAMTETGEEYGDDHVPQGVALCGIGCGVNEIHC